MISVRPREARTAGSERFPVDLKDLAYGNCVELAQARWKSGITVSRRSRFTSDRPGHRAMGRTHEHEGLEGDAPSAEGSRREDDLPTTGAQKQCQAKWWCGASGRAEAGQRNVGFRFACEIQRRHRLRQESRRPGRHRTKSRLGASGRFHPAKCWGRGFADPSRGRPFPRPRWSVPPVEASAAVCEHISPKKTPKVSIPPFLVRRLSRAGTRRVRTSQKTTRRKTYESHGNRQGQQGVRGGYPS